MYGFLIRRSLPSLAALLGLAFAGGAVLVMIGAPPWLPVVAAVVIVWLQWAINPLLIQWLVPAAVIRHDGQRYDTDHPVGAIVAKRCHEAGLRLPRLGIIDDGTPNAFTFGHTRGTARIWISRGLMERLDERELDAVVSHEVGHIRNNDFIVMTVAATIPALLYFVYLATRNAARKETLPVMVGSYIAYLVSQLVLLAVSRARELAADHHSCAVTSDGDALCSALVKIAYGMGQVREEQEAAVHRLQEQLKGRSLKEKREGQKEIAAVRRQGRRMRSLRMMGIADPEHAKAVLVAAEQGLEPEHVLGAMRWDTCNPWARFLEKLSSHPIVVNRIAALERSGLPGAPHRWGAVRVAASCDGPELTRARRRFLGELVIGYGWIVAAGVGLIGYATGSASLVGIALLAGGVVLIARALAMSSPGEHEPVDRVASLLERLDASPVTGLSVNIRGRVIGRGVPGYVLSPDMVVQDESGFVPVLYLQPLPFAREVFALVRAGRYSEQEVQVRGWYRRGPGPMLELREIVAADGTRSRAWWWALRLGIAVLVLLAGVIGTIATV